MDFTPQPSGLDELLISRIMRVSDYIIKSLETAGLDTAFSLTGGFAMHLNDSIGKSSVFRTYYNHHEQACGYAALGYTKTINKPCVVCTTSGIAATNTISPCLDAYQDSVSILFLTGQVKTFDTVRALNSTTGRTLRNYAFSDCDIISMVSSITKYSHELTRDDDVRKVMSEVITALTTGRGGPVWLSVPLDIQGSRMEECIPEIPRSVTSLPSIKLDDVYTALSSSTRPILLAGNGIKLAGCGTRFRTFVETHKIPVVTSYLGADLIESASPYFVGRVGLYADRCGNFAIQNSDLILVLGCRLSQAVVGYNPKTFARDATIVYVDIDPTELAKESIPYHVPVLADLNAFFESFQFTCPDTPDWRATCQHWKSKWLFETPPRDPDTDVINPYHAVKMIFDTLPENKIVTTGSGSIAIIVNQLVNIKTNDTFIWSGHGDMGTDLPMSIGSHIADPSKQFVLFTSEGTLQFNIQELQTIVHHKLPLKIIVFNNASYGAIEITQRTFFNAKFGVDAVSGLSFPDTGKIAQAYGIEYIRVDRIDELDDGVRRGIDHDGPVILEVFCCLQVRYPRMSSVKNDDGTFTSRPFEDMEPLLPRDEFYREMIVNPLS
jgi:acetolactate synthase I/II/III large subunit